KSLHDPPHLDARGVRNQVYRPVFARGKQHGLLRFDDAFVFLERRVDLSIQRLGDLGLVLPEAVGRGPEVEAACFGDRCQAMEYANGHAVLVAVFLCAFSNIYAAGPLDDGRGRYVFEFGPTIYIALELDDLGVGGRRGAVEQPAHVLEAVVAGSDDRLGVDVHVRVAAYGRLVHITHVRHIHQVVHHQLIACLDFVYGVLVRPALVVVMEGVVDDARFIGQFGIAHPDPDELVLFDDGIMPDAGLGGNLVLGRNLDALSGAVEHHAVIAALEPALDDLAKAQRRGPMATSIFQRTDLSRVVAEEYDGLVHDGAGKGRLFDLMGPGAYVPGVSNEHGVRSE